MGKWVNLVKLKEKGIWEVEANSSDSCGWKNMLALRDRIKGHVIHEARNGQGILCQSELKVVQENTLTLVDGRVLKHTARSIWIDQHGLRKIKERGGPVSSLEVYQCCHTKRGLVSENITTRAKRVAVHRARQPVAALQLIILVSSSQECMVVADMLVNGEWRWPITWYTRFLILQTIAVPVLQNETKQVWLDLRTNGPKVPWSLSVRLGVSALMDLLSVSEVKECSHRIGEENVQRG
ncbi:hypothetical protein Tco_0218551 [Tanacetum coccineum]